MIDKSDGVVWVNVAAIVCDRKAFPRAVQHLTAQCKKCGDVMDSAIDVYNWCCDHDYLDWMTPDFVAAKNTYKKSLVTLSVK